MYLRYLVISALCFTGIHLVKDQLLSILELRKNLFYRLNEEIQISINKIFSILKLDKKFTNSAEASILLALHNELTKISEENYREYEKMRNISRIETDKKINLILYELVCEIFKGDRHYFTYSQYERKHKRKHKDTIEHFNEPEEPMDFIKDFVDKLNTFTEDSSPRENLDDIQMDRTPKPRHFYYDIKIWRPIKNITEETENFPMTRRLYKGRRTTFKKHPFIVSIHIMGEFFCAGSIISRDMVITAASCLQIAYTSKIFNANARSVTVRVGSDFTDRFGDIIPVSETFFHPEYHALTLKNNLAIIRLSRSLNFEKRNGRVRRIQYDQRNTGYSGKEAVKVLGWGATKESQTNVSSNMLAFTRLSIYDFNKCADLYSRFYVTDDNFCAGFVDKRNGACIRDVGGPAIVDAVLVGVVSFGPPTCGALDAPTVFTKLSYYRAWIEIITEKGSSTEKTKNTKQVSIALRNNVVKADPDEHTQQTVSDRKPQARQLGPFKSPLGLSEVIQDLLTDNENTDDDLETDRNTNNYEDSSGETERGLSLESIVQNKEYIQKDIVPSDSESDIKYTLVDKPTTQRWGPIGSKSLDQAEDRAKPDPFLGIAINTSSAGDPEPLGISTNLNINLDLIAPVLQFFKDTFLKDTSTVTDTDKVPIIDTANTYEYRTTLYPSTSRPTILVENTPTQGIDNSEYFKDDNNSFRSDSDEDDSMSIDNKFNTNNDQGSLLENAKIVPDVQLDRPLATEKKAPSGYKLDGLNMMNSGKLHRKNFKIHKIM